MKFIVRTVPGREEFVRHIIERIPGAIIVADTRYIASAKFNLALPNFADALSAAGDDDAVHMEDDIVLAHDFMRHLDDAIWERPDDVVQFFSMRSADISIGSRWEPASSFMMTQCFRLPAGMSADLLAFSKMRFSNRTGQDTLVKDWLKARKHRYWLHVPSLVQHRNCVSVIDRRRSRNRQSPTFKGEAA